MIDWTRVAGLRDEVGADDFDEVVEIFLEEVDGELAGLSASCSADALAEKLHFLKGSALNLGFSDFAALCENGEADLRCDAAAHIDVQAIIDAYQAARAHFLNDLPTRLAGGPGGLGSNAV